MKLPMLHTKSEDDDAEVVDGVICFDPELGPVGDGPWGKEPDQYKVYETIQGKMNFTTMEGEPLFGHPDPYPASNGGLRWNEENQRYERDPLAYQAFDTEDSIRYMMGGRFGRREPRLKIRIDPDALKFTVEELKEAQELMNEYFISRNKKQKD